MTKKIVIVGSGLSGTLLANRLVDFFDVTVIEKGDQYHLQSNDVTKTKLASVPTFAFGRGGTTNLWHNGLIYPNDGEFCSDSVNILVKELRPYIDDVAKELYFKEEAPISLLYSEGKPIFEGFSINHIYYPNSYKYLSLNSGVTTRYNTEIIQVDGQKKSITLNNGEQLNYDYLVFCCGGLSTSTLLMNLNLIKKPLSFIDHPMGFVGKVKIKREYKNEFSSLHSKKLVNGSLKTGFVLQHKTGNKAIFYLRPSFTLEDDEELSRFKSKIGASNGVRRLKNMFSLNMLHPDILAEIFYKLFGFPMSKRYYNILFVAEQLERSNILEGERVELMVSDNEMKIYQEMIDEFQRCISKYTSETNLRSCIRKSDLWSAAHYSGTLPMEKYTTRDLELIDHQGIFVCDPSVLPEHSYVNTGLLIGALAFQLADKFIEEAL